MKVIKFGEAVTTNTVLALGYFDSAHIGHKALLNKAIERAKSLNATPSALIFTGNFKGNGDVFSFNERLERLKLIGVETVIHAELTTDFLNLSYSEFLNAVFSLINVKALVCGDDFTFGKNAVGNVEKLKIECEKRNIALVVADKITTSSGEKISTFSVKKHLLLGEIEKANELLGDNYFITEKVIKGKRLGNTIGFPTANMVASSVKSPLKHGVYKTHVILGGKKYLSITNYGAQPTVNGENVIIETYISKYFGDLYGQNLTVYFDGYLRDIKKFSTVEELKNQLSKDERSLYD